MKQNFTCSFFLGKVTQLCLFMLLPGFLFSRTLEVGPGKSFSSIMAALETVKTASSAESFEILVAPGLYKEQVVLEGISNIITIRPENEIPNSVVIQYSASSLKDNFTVKLSNTQNITIEGLEIHAAGDEYSTALFLEGKNTNIEISNCILKGRDQGGNAISQSVVFCDDRFAAENLSILDCEIEGGSFGIFGGGVSEDLRDHNLTINGNILTSQQKGGFYLKYLTGAELSNNVINTSTKEDAFVGITLFDVVGDLNLTANLVNFESGTAGIHLVNVEGSALNYGEVKNNSITLGFTPQSNGFLIEGSSDFLFLDFNRVKFRPGLRDPALFAFYKNLSSGESINMVNNIFYNLDSGGYTVVGNAFQKFLEQSGEGSKQFSTQINSLKYEEVR